jgi:hypothetical protein
MIRTVAGEQYLSVAGILLELSKPQQDTPQFGIHGREESQADIEGHVLKICGLAFTNDNISARVNAFGPLAFCKSSSMILIGRGIDVKQVADT